MEARDCLVVCNEGLVYTHDHLLHELNNRHVASALTPHIAWIQCHDQDAPPIIPGLERLGRIPNENVKKGKVRKPRRQGTKADDDDGEQAGDNESSSAWTENLRNDDQDKLQFEKPDFRKLGSDLYAGLQEAWSSPAARGGTARPFLPVGGAY